MNTSVRVSGMIDHVLSYGINSSSGAIEFGGKPVGANVGLIGGSVSAESIRRAQEFKELSRAERNKALRINGLWVDQGETVNADPAVTEISDRVDARVRTTENGRNPRVHQTHLSLSADRPLVILNDRSHGNTVLARDLGIEITEINLGDPTAQNLPAVDEIDPGKYPHIRTHMHFTKAPDSARYDLATLGGEIYLTGSSTGGFGLRVAKMTLLTIMQAVKTLNGDSTDGAVITAARLDSARGSIELPKIASLPVKDLRTPAFAVFHSNDLPGPLNLNLHLRLADGGEVFLQLTRGDDVRSSVAGMRFHQWSGRIHAGGDVARVFGGWYDSVQRPEHVSLQDRMQIVRAQQRSARGQYSSSQYYR